MASKKVAKRPRVLDDKNRVVVETSRGVRLVCHPIIVAMEAQEENIRAQFEWPDVPQRQVDVPPDAGPDWPSAMDLTQEFIDSKFATDEHKANWAAYVDERDAVTAAFTAKLNDARLRLIVRDGVTLADEVDDDSWVEEHEWLGMSVPEKPLDRLIHYFRTEVLGTAIDLITITTGIYRAGGMDAEVLDRYEASFRTEMERTFRKVLEPDQNDTETEEQEET